MHVRFYLSPIRYNRDTDMWEPTHLLKFGKARARALQSIGTDRGQPTRNHCVLGIRVKDPKDFPEEAACELIRLKPDRLLGLAAEGLPTAGLTAASRPEDLEQRAHAWMRGAERDLAEAMGYKGPEWVIERG